MSRMHVTPSKTLIAFLIFNITIKNYKGFTPGGTSCKTASARIGRSVGAVLPRLLK